MDGLSNIPPEYLAENTGGSLVRVGIAFTVLETVFVVLFFISRYINKTLKGLEIWFIIWAYLWSLSLCVLAILLAEQGGAGRHIIAVLAEDPHQFVVWLKIEFVVQYAWPCAVTFPKLAILSLYLNIFVKRNYRIVAKIAGLILILNLIALIFVTSFMCRPFAFNWDKTIPGGQCGDLALAFKLVSIPNLLTDCVILVLPLPMIWKLHSSVARKIGLTATFVIGSFGIITAIIRLYYFSALDLFSDPTWISVTTMAWTTVEPGCYLIAAIMPNLLPLWRHVRQTKRFTSIRSHLLSSTGRQTPQSDSATLRGSESKSSRESEIGTIVSERLDNNKIIVTHAYNVEPKLRDEDLP